MTLYMCVIFMSPSESVMVHGTAAQGHETINFGGQEVKGDAKGHTRFVGAWRRHHTGPLFQSSSCSSLVCVWYYSGSGVSDVPRNTDTLVDAFVKCFSSKSTFVYVM